MKLRRRLPMKMAQKLATYCLRCGQRQNEHFNHQCPFLPTQFLGMSKRAARKHILYLMGTGNESIALRAQLIWRMFR